MALNTIWVYAEAADGKVSPHHPRDARQGPRARRHRRGRLRRRRRRRRRRRARRPRRHQGPRHRRPRRLARRACRSPRPSPRRSSDGNGPDLILFGTTYDGRDIAGRLSVALDKPVLTNNVDVAVDGDAVVVTEPIFGGTKLVQDQVHRRRPAHRARSGPKSFAAEESGGGAAEVVDARGARHRAPAQGHRTATSRRPPARSSTRPPSSSPAAVASARPASTR